MRNILIFIDMNIATYLPSAILSPYVSAFLIIESAEGMENRVMPDTAVVMSFRFSGQVRAEENELLPSAGLAGLRKSSRLLQYAPGTGNVLVKFKEGGAAAFFKAPLHELFDTQQSLDSLLRQQQIREVEERLYEAADHLQRIAIVESFLISSLSSRAPDLLIRSAVAQIKTAHGDVKIKALASEHYISQDAFEKRFRRQVGSTPKQFSAIVRLRHLLDHCPAADSLTEAAYEAGYYDQAHFIKDFRAFTGQSPQAFFQQSTWW
ncbi:helix-turn-helix domain-containing protein [Chitinophaga arvensicola]|uniref:Helix-turn-helix domain-containing protein n=1 Tax=Chitinophaga arvensicola TaxID=29529 RepID=A0A1I0REE7_9BACT|nr:helix-turn-helix domain-containing protein [Chitinophaga arvensicola]SEW39054.1 Helix-turn-helix domain-containing protein [Chitinophaga arvensicola]